MSFSGVFQHAIDAKGRTSLPARFRDVLAGAGADKLFVTTDLYERFLLAYAPAQWNAFTQKVAALPQFAATTRHLMRTVVAPAQECPFDKLGRILIPASLREHAELSSEIVWAGSIERIEIWSPAGWKKCQEAARSPEVQAELVSTLAKIL
ncbi:MAG: division/cell wall cluster transcriptional repressor MraZ [Deltaproteobacteria bacterium]|nr:division/cell wall cluster transcriptional repressor MraZ [Deltaproteobacteria bacterium]